MAITARLRLAFTRLAAVAVLASVNSAWACFECREIVEARVYGPDFASNLLALLLPLLILAAIGALPHFSDAILHKLRQRR